MTDDILDTRFEGKKIELSDNKVEVGEDINIMAKDPALRLIHAGVGWDMNAFDADPPDLDVSIFMIGKDDMTRIDEDFVFYNQPETPEKAVVHQGDNRTGAGDGDDEVIAIDLQGIPFDVMRLTFVLSIYKGEEKAQDLGMVRNTYIRLVNAENQYEILRFDLDEHIKDKSETAMIIAHLNREGPKWHFVPAVEFVPGGLGAAAERFGLMITQQ